jgi:hypothetical protein
VPKPSSLQWQRWCPRRAKARIADLGGIGLAGSPDEFGKFIAKEREKWAKVIREANIKVE